MESGSIAMEELTLESVKAEIYARNNPTLTSVDIELHAEHGLDNKLQKF